MTFEVGEALNYMIDGFLKAPIVNSIAKNPIYTALAITLIIILILLFIFRDIEADETVLTLALRSGFWIFLMLLGVMMIHNRVLLSETSVQKREGEYEQVFKDTPAAAARFDTDFVPIRPNGSSVSGGGMQSGMSGGVSSSNIHSGGNYAHHSGGMHSGSSNVPGSILRNAQGN